MSNPLIEDYLRWLGPQIRDENDIQDYWGLISIMFEKEYPMAAALHVPNDDNRLGDGIALRSEFCFSQHLRVDCLNNIGPCSFLEVLIGLSRRLSFAAGGNSRYWAWELVRNLRLDRSSDPLSRYKVRKLDDIMDTVIWRTYRSDGVGGFFPLAWPEYDQLRIEMWYQMSAYIAELHPEH